MTPEDFREALDLLVGGSIVMKAELEGLTRGAPYRKKWHARVELLLKRYGRNLSTCPSPAYTAPPADQAGHPPGCEGNVLPFVSGRVSTLAEVTGQGFDEYQPMPPGGSL